MQRKRLPQWVHERLQPRGFGQVARAEGAIEIDEQARRHIGTGGDGAGSQVDLSAATSFQVLKQRWHEDASKLNQALRGIGDGLTQNRSNYATTEETNQQGFSSISSRLG